MATYYAWSNFSDEKGKRIKLGEEVSAEILGISNEDFADMVESGAARTSRYPEIPETYSGSPVEYMKEQLAAQTDEALTNAWATAYPVPEHVETELAASEGGSSTPTEVEEETDPLKTL